MKKFKDSEIKEVSDLYFKFKSAYKVAEIYKCDVRTVLKFLKKHLVKVDMRVSKTKYKCNNKVFDNINCDNAYWIGFLMADGSHDESRNNFSLVQRTSESENLDLFKKFLEYDGDIKHYIKPDGIKYSRLYITDLILSKKLSILGIIQNKTHLLIFPKYIDNELLFKNFLRGYFDGDGSISHGILKIVGNKEFLTSLQNYLIKYLGLNKTIFNKRHKERDNEILTMSYGGRNNILKLFKFIYEDATYYSKYKKQKFMIDINKMWNNTNNQKTDKNLINWYNNHII